MAQHYKIIRWLRLAEYDTGSVRHNSPRPTADQVEVVADEVRVLPDEVRVLPDEVRVLPD